ncbi:hypothetical protein L596_000383 [Steinernema carpocapsae]|uniref:Uncharacterized protein n=1 Tax=Steinernema carpocapsae TaxID=34508 RepID=A0A4U8UI03_STECR|nr:hypothetical protein L596_000383 [Steinernema carpocapsae]
MIVKNKVFQHDGFVYKFIVEVNGDHWSVKLFFLGSLFSYCRRSTNRSIRRINRAATLITSIEGNSNGIQAVTAL